MNPVWWVEVASAGGAWLAEAALKSALLLAVLLLVDQLLGERRATWRNLLWHTGLAGLILIPLAVAWGPSLRVRVPAPARALVPTVLPASPAPAVEGKVSVPPPATAPVREPAVSRVAPALAPESPAPAWAWPSILVLIYGAGVLFFLGRLGVGLLYVATRAGGYGNCATTGFGRCSRSCGSTWASAGRCAWG